MIILYPIYHISQIDNAYKLLPMYKKEVKEVHTLLVKEAGYSHPRVNLKNKYSTAFGLGQFLDSTWKSVGIKKTYDPIKQIKAVIIYCNNRYGSVKNANIAWNRRGFFDSNSGLYKNGWY